jgi:hypothetical protein
MKNKGFWMVFLLLFLLTACGKSPEESDKKENVQKLVETQQTIMKASSDVHKNVMDAVKNFDPAKMKYDTLKNIIKTNQEEQKSLLDKINAQRTTEYRNKVLTYFASVIEDRINSYDELLKLVRIQDAEALKVLHDSIQKKEVQFEKGIMTEINELLKSKKVKEINSLKK